MAFASGALAGPLTDLGRGLALEPDMNRYTNGSAQGHQLFDCGGPVSIRSHQHGLAALFLEMPRQLGRHGGLAHALEPGEHDRGGSGGALEIRIYRTHQFDQFVFAYLDEMLARSGFDGPPGGVAGPGFDLLAQGTVLDPGEEILDHRKVDIRLEERHADVRKRLVDIRLMQLTHTAQSFGCCLEALADGFEHVSPGGAGA